MNESKSENEDSAFPLPSKSSSTELEDHDYNHDGNELTVNSDNNDEVVLVITSPRKQQQQQQQFPPSPAMPSLVDNAYSPTSSVFSMTSEMPFDERGSYEEASRQAQYVAQTSASVSASADNNSSGRRGGGNKKLWSRIFRRRSNHHDHDHDHDPDDQTMTTKEQQQQLPQNSIINNNTPTQSFGGSTMDDNNNNKDVTTTTTTTTSKKITRSPIFSWWTWCTEMIIHATLIRFVVRLSGMSARYPYRTVCGMSLLSILVLAIGFFTNFELIVDTEVIFTPQHSLPVRHYEWLQAESHFNNVRPLVMILHANGHNVLGKSSLEQLFDAVDTVRQTPGYEALCQEGSYRTYDNHHTCRILSATRFWNHNRTVMEQSMMHPTTRTNTSSDDDDEHELIDLLSQSTYPGSQTPVFHDLILGNAEWSTATLEYNAANDSFSVRTHTDHPRLHFAQSFFVRIELPSVVGPDADEFENRALERLNQLKQKWKKEARQQEEQGNDDSINATTTTTTTMTPHLQLDFLSIYAYKVENQRALIRDMPLVTGIFLVLIIFTTFVFTKRHPVYSRSLLGCASLATIGVSLFMSYGIVWCIGVPFTNIAQILPFMIMGVGLDDTFIITGAYFRTDPNLTIEKRVETTMKEVGLSISLTSITTMVAFLLGSFSNIPGVKWLCYYAFSAIVCDFLFQITFFIALLVLDERRLQAYRHNCCFWKRVPVDVDECESQMGIIISASYDTGDDDDNNDDDRRRGISDHHHEGDGGDDKFDDGDIVDQEGRAGVGSSSSRRRRHQLEHNMVVVHKHNKQNKTTTKYSSKHFSERLMIWYGEQLMRPTSKILVLLTFTGYFIFCCWRTTMLTQEFNVEDYTPKDSYLRGALRSLDEYYSLTKPLQVYFRDVDQSDPDMQEQMRNYVSELAALPQINQDSPFCWVRDFPQIEERYPQHSFLQNLTFNEQLRVALANPTIREIYGEDIVVDQKTGDITASRCLLFLQNVDLSVVNDQIDLLQGQRQVTMNQPINVDQDEWPFFSFDTIFFYWELYSQAVKELIQTIVTGVVAVTLVAFLLIPHWSAILFVCPGIIIMYLTFLGTMQWMGLHINSLTYVIIVMAIGLLVDSLVHILLRYYETNEETREGKVKETLRTMGASMFVGGLTTFLSVCPLVFSTTHIFMTVFWAFMAIVVLGITHGLILLPVILSVIGPVATHQKKSAAIAPLHDELQKNKPTNSSTSSAASSSGRACKFDDEILESTTEEELEELTSDVTKDPPEKRTVPFLGPSYDLEAIEEGPDSTKHQPDSTTSAKSRQTILQAPSDEITSVSPRHLIAQMTQQPVSHLSQFITDTYSCAADFNFYNDAVEVVQRGCKNTNEILQGCKNPTR